MFVLCGGLGALGILFSYLYNKFQNDKGYNIILTENQANTYNDAKTSKEPRQFWMTLEDEYIPAPESPCLLSFYNLVTNRKFDSFVMFLIIFDNVVLSMDHYNQTETFDAIVYYLRLVVLLFFIVEMVVKWLSWGKHYFRNAWNYLDMLVVITGILGKRSLNVNV